LEGVLVLDQHGLGGVLRGGDCIAERLKESDDYGQG
jgi:hypothetical protein